MNFRVYSSGISAAADPPAKTRKVQPPGEHTLQVDHVAGFLEGELSASGEADLVVVGHSIGAWVALEAVRRLGANQRRVSACLGLLWWYLRPAPPRALPSTSCDLWPGTVSISV